MNPSDSQPREDKPHRGDEGTCRFCKRVITFAGNHKEFGPLWRHRHNGVAWCEVGADATRNTIGAPEIGVPF